MKNHKLIILMMGCSFIFLGGCSSRSISSGFIENEGLTVNEIYAQTTAELDEDLATSALKSSKAHYRSKKGRGDKAFNRVTNPSIPLFIYPHVAKIGDEEVVKPGMNTEFFLYKKDRYAYAWEKY